MGKNFIKTIEIGDYRDDKQVLEIAQPKAGHNAITVLCGKNSTGKTHVLKLTSNVWGRGHGSNKENQNQSENVNVTFTVPEAPLPSALYLNSTTFAKGKFFTIPIKQPKPDPAGRRPKYREAAISFIKRLLRPASGTPYDTAFFETHFPSGNIYKCDQEDPVVIAFQEAAGALLYFCYYPDAAGGHIELVLRENVHRRLRYLDWSDGQQALFASFLIIDHHRPDVLLIDEIENHLHPEYMTRLTEFVKKQVPQTVMVTHHPHIMFSKLVDKKYYFGLQPFEREAAPAVEKFSKDFQSRSPRRAVRDINSEFELLRAAYELFHDKDCELLHLAEQFRTSVDMEFTKSLINIFKNDPAPAGRSPFADTQTSQTSKLLQLIKASQGARADQFDVLDYGAGRGRTLIELLKESPADLTVHLHWRFWDPSPERRQELKAVAEKQSAPCKVTVIEEITGHPSGAFDLVILSNVAHEVTPDRLTEILITARRLLRQEGKLVVLELSPLINAEKYAVPYSRDNLTELFNSIGWKAYPGAIPIKSGMIQSYFVCAHSPDTLHSCNPEWIRTKIKSLWTKILQMTCKEYDAKFKIASVSDQLSLVENLTTIASIMNYKSGNWK